MGYIKLLGASELIEALSSSAFLFLQKSLDSASACRW